MTDEITKHTELLTLRISVDDREWLEAEGEQLGVDAVAALAVALTMNAAAVDSVFAAAGGMSL